MAHSFPNHWESSTNVLSYTEADWLAFLTFEYLIPFTTSETHKSVSRLKNWWQVVCANSETVQHQVWAIEASIVALKQAPTCANMGRTWWCRFACEPPVVLCLVAVALLSSAAAAAGPVLAWAGAWDAQSAGTRMVGTAAGCRKQEQDM